MNEGIVVAGGKQTPCADLMHFADWVLTGPQVIGRVPGVLKMTGKGAEKDKAMYGEKGTGADVMSTLAFEPPMLVRWSRFDASGNTRFITAFYCCPAGAQGS